MTRNSREDALEDNEVDMLISAAKGHDRDIITMLIFTGMRVSELTHMTKDWIKWQKEIIQIPGESNEWKPKTKAGARTIPIIDKRLIEALRSYFYHYEDIGYSRQTIWNKVKKAAENTKITHKVYPHALRATLATKLAHLGISATSLQHIMGWADLKNAEKYIKASGARALEEVRSKWK